MFYYFFFYFNYECQLILGSIQPAVHVIATNNDLLMEELNAIYFAPKWCLYIMIWVPHTTDNSTYFAQSLEIRGIESRLYLRPSFSYHFPLRPLFCPFLSGHLFLRKVLLYVRFSNSWNSLLILLQ